MSSGGTKVLVTGKMSPDSLTYLKKGKGLSVDYAPGLTGQALQGALKDANALIVRTETEITRALLSQAPRLEVICRAGIGVDHIDLQACAERQIVVMNTPGANRVSTAEHTIALLLALAKQIPQSTKAMRAGIWDQDRFSGMEVAQKTLTIVGLGNIGQRVAVRARALGMEVLAFDPYLDPSVAMAVNVRLLPLKVVLKEAHFVSIHVPLTDETKGMVNENFLSQMRDSSYLINSSRGKVVDEMALIAALDSGRLKGAALDVFETEPLSPSSALLKIENVIVTPHVAGKTNESQLAMSQDAAQQIREYFEEGTVINAVLKY